MKYHIFLGFVAAVSAYPTLVHEEAPQLEEKHDLIGHTGHHHAIEHEHAKSHQSIKFEHFHPVPVYIKKEFSHLLHHPLEKGKSEQKLKQIHPETEHKYGGGLVLEDHRLDTEHLAAAFQHGGGEGGFGEGYELLGNYQGDLGEGLKGFANEGHGFYGEGQSIGEGQGLSEGYHYEGSYK